MSYIGIAHNFCVNATQKKQQFARNCIQLLERKKNPDTIDKSIRVFVCIHSNMNQLWIMKSSRYFKIRSLCRENEYAWKRCCGDGEWWYMCIPTGYYPHMFHSNRVQWSSQVYCCRAHNDTREYYGIKRINNFVQCSPMSHLFLILIRMHWVLA